MKRLELIISDYTNALNRLEEATNKASSELEIDGAIQRFEFTFELLWKLLKIYLQNEGLTRKTPRECLKTAYEIEIIENEKIWLKMLEDRNLTVYLYDNSESREIYARVKKDYVPVFKGILKRIQLELSK